jgi:hypothetical protein
MLTQFVGWRRYRCRSSASECHSGPPYLPSQFPATNNAQSCTRPTVACMHSFHIQLLPRHSLEVFTRRRRLVTNMASGDQCYNHFLLSVGTVDVQRPYHAGSVSSMLPQCEEFGLSGFARPWTSSVLFFSWSGCIPTIPNPLIPCLTRHCLDQVTANPRVARRTSRRRVPMKAAYCHSSSPAKLCSARMKVKHTPPQALSRSLTARA